MQLFSHTYVLLYMQVLDLMSISVMCARTKMSQDNVSFWPSNPIFGELPFMKLCCETVFVFEVHSLKDKATLSETQNKSASLYQVAEVDAGLC